MTASVLLALRAVRARLGVSAAVVLVGVFVVASAAVGPLWLRASGESVFQDVLAGSGAAAIGVSVELPGTAQQRPQDRLRHAAGSAAAGATAFADAVVGLQQTVLLPAAGSSTVDTLLVARDGVCGHVVLRGRCPRAAGEVLLTRAALSRLGGRAGRYRVVGTYALTDPAAGYWGGRTVVGDPGRVDPAAPQFEQVDALLTVPASLRGPVVGVLDLPLRSSRARLFGTTGQQAAAVTTALRAALPDATVTTGLPQLLARARSSADLLRVPVLLVVLQLLVLSCLVLSGVVGSSVEARGPEVALAKLRGLSAPATVAFGLLEPLLLLAAALVPGVALALGAVAVLARHALSPAAPVTLTGGAVLAAALAVLGGATAAALAARATLARPALEQFRRTAPTGGRRGVVVDAVVFVLAAAGLLQLAVSGAVSGGRVDPVSLLTPGLLSLAVALLAARGLPAACRALVGPTSGRRGLGSYLAVRHVARRPAGARTVVLLVVAFGLATFSVSSWAVVRQNRHDRALAETGAPVMAYVQASGGADLSAVVDRVDPRGRWAMAVSELDVLSSSATGRSVLAVDSGRLAAVAYWRPDFAALGPDRLAQLLAPPVAPSVAVRGSTLQVDLQVPRLAVVPALPVHLLAELRDAGGLPRTADLGILRAGRHRAAVPCTAGCRLTDLRIGRTGFATVTGAFVLTRVAVDGRTVDAGLTDAARWAPLASEGDAPTLHAGPADLQVDLATTQTSSPAAAVADVPRPLPAVITASLGGTGAPVTAVGLDQASLVVQPVAVAAALPRGLADGLLLDRTYALRTLGTSTSRAREEVWLGAAAPPDALNRLRAAGLTIDRVERARDREAVLSRQGPALALLLFLVGAGAATLLAAGGTVLNLYLLGRRRVGELAAMLVLGVSRRALRRAVLLEQALLLGTGALAGVGAGLLGAVLALPSVPEADDVPAAPSLLLTPPAGVLVAVVTATLLLLAAAVAAASLALVRQARPDLLREAGA